ncbi:MAG: tetratricopeptide repeat protein [Bacteroidetes bacterium]|nr:tetratricopeptide repeat protein [Bacteroidota bacterium]MBU1678542.1 tetratricopeptide repeat protein [Bacteroidota bacterium]MBU2505894.1 tetratricopeptide repeat protein [Bacteroidota bacterium]
MRLSKKYFLLLLLMALLSGCSVWENFTTYFNRYYNASLEFEEAELAIASDLNQKLFDFKEVVPNTKARQQLDKVIEKCSNILQFSKESDFIDDALFMIGRAFYLQGNYTKALRKFRELEQLKDSDLLLENQLWIGKTELQLRNFERGVQILEAVRKKAISEEEIEIAVQSYLAHIRFTLYRENYTQSILLVNELLNISESDELNAEISYELGNLYYLNENLAAAADAYLNVQNYSPDFDVDFNSRLEFAKVKRELGANDESLEILEYLRKQEKYKDRWDDLELEIGNIHYANLEIEEALKMYTIVDTTYKNTKSAGIAAFRRAEIFEKDFFNYDSAISLYDRMAKTSAPVEYKNEARMKTGILKKRDQLLATMRRLKRQLVYLEDAALFSKDSAEYFNYYARKDSATALAKEMQTLQGTSYNPKDYEFTEKAVFIAQPVKPKVSADSMKTDIAKSEYDLGNLFFGELEVPDSAFYYYDDILTNFRDTPLEAKVLYAMGSYYLTINEKEIADSLFEEVYNNHKYDQIVNAAAEKLGKESVNFSTDPAEKLFVSAEEKYLTKNYNAAIKELYSINKEFPQSNYSAKSLYTIGWILENDLFLLDSAAAVYDTLALKYKRTDYATAVQNKLTFYKTRQKAAQDSVARIAQAKIDSIRTDSVKTAQAKLQLEFDATDKQENQADIVEENPPFVPENDAVLDEQAREFFEALKSDSTKTRNDTIPSGKK